MDSVNWNDGINTFLLPGIILPRREITFDEVRSYTGAIRQVDVHLPLTKASIPLMIKGTDTYDLEYHVGLVLAGILTGGVLTYGEAAEEGSPGTQIAYRAGKSPEPEIIHDYAYRKKSIASFVAEIWVAL